MKKKVIILFFPRTLHEKNYRNYHVPYSILAIAAVIDLDKYEVILVDDNIYKKDNYNELLLEYKEQLFCVGISSMIGAQINYALSFAEQVRKIKSNIKIIWGGPLVTVLPEEVASNDLVDIGIIGQGEKTFLEVINCLEKEESVDQIKGIVFKDDSGKVCVNSAQPFEDLNVFKPYSEVYHLLDLREYIRPDEHISDKTISYHSSQGCPFTCGYCAEVTLWNRRWCGFSVSRIINDIKYIMNNYSVNGIKFYDSEFFIDKGRVLDFVESVITNNLNISWAASAHPLSIYKMSNSEMLLLKKSGLKRLLIGAETGVADELKLIKKSITKEIVFEVAKKCADYGIVVCFTFVTGYPSMPNSYIDQNFEFAKEIKTNYPLHEIKLHFYGPYPGTPLYNLALEYGFKPPTSLEEWSKFDYYNILTPWIDPKYAPILRSLNEEYYPYIHPCNMLKEV